MIAPEELLAHCEKGIRSAVERGADQAEVCGGAIDGAEVELQKDDLHTAATESEVSFGIRVFKGGSLGFATVNGADRIDEACAEALAMAAAAPPDPRNGLAEPREVKPLDRAPDPAIADLDVSRLVKTAAGMLDAVKGRDPRVRIDSGGAGASRTVRAIATSTGIRLAESGATASAYLFGMAVDGDDVGSFATEGTAVLQAAELESEVERVIERFVTQCTDALGARKGETFRGTVILAPEVVGSFVLGNLLSVLSAQAVRTGKSPLAKRVGEAIAAPGFTLIDDPRLPEGVAGAAFDREGTPTRRTPIVTAGVLDGFLYDVYEARAAGVEPTGHARGGASTLPSIGTSNRLVEPGETPLADLCAEPERAVLVNRFSGSSNPITGEFSGVVKGGSLLSRGARTSIHETLIAGNLYDLLQRISGLSVERRCLQGRAWLPTLRVEDVSITAG